MPGPLALAGIQAGASLVGGLLQRNSAKKAAREQRANALEDYRTSGVRAREAAELGGFNPVTFLGLAGINEPPSGVSSLSSGDVIARALNVGAEAYASYDPIMAESMELENELTRARIEQIRSEPPSFSPATLTPSKEYDRADWNPDQLMYYWKPNLGVFEVPVGGKLTRFDPNHTAPAQVLEDMQGNLAGEGASLLNFLLGMGWEQGGVNPETVIDPKKQGGFPEGPKLPWQDFITNPQP